MAQALDIFDGAEATVTKSVTLISKQDGHGVTKPSSIHLIIATATVDIEVSNDPLAEGDTPDSADWHSIGQYTASEIFDPQAQFAKYMRLNISINTGSVKAYGWNIKKT